MNKEEQHQKEVNDQINLQLRKDRYESRKEMKCVLLGTPSSGKGTFLKQMKILYGEGYTLEERKTFIRQVHGNVFQGMQMLILALETLNIELAAPETCSSPVAVLRDVDKVHTVLNVEHADAIRTLWAGRGIQEVWARRNEILYLQDAVSYFFEHIERIGSVDLLNTHLLMRTFYACTLHLIVASQKTSLKWTVWYSDSSRLIVNFAMHHTGRVILIIQ